MSKNKKNHNNNRNRRTRFAAIRPDENICEWFVNSMNYNPSVNHILDLLGIVNAAIVGRCALNGGEPDEGTKEQCMEFVSMFYEVDWPQEDAIYNGMNNRWPKGLFFFNLGDDLLEAEIQAELDIAQEHYDTLPNHTRRSIKSLLDYILNLNRVVSISFVFEKSDPYVFQKPAELDDDQKEIAAEDLWIPLVRACYEGGSFVMRVCDDPENGPFDMYGAKFSKDNVHSLEKDRLQCVCQFQPDGTFTEFPDQRYHKLPLVLY